MKFLIADDHAIVRKGLAQLLREEFSDAEIQEASNSNEIIEKATSGIWDIILTHLSLLVQ